MTSAKTDLAHALVEVPGALEDLDFDPHEVDGEVAPVDFRKADGVLLSGNDGFGLAFLAAVDGVDDFLLGETVMICT